MERLRQLIHEIHRRALWQVLGSFRLGGWVAFKIVQTLTEDRRYQHVSPPRAVESGGLKTFESVMTLLRHSLRERTSR